MGSRRRKKKTTTAKSTGTDNAVSPAEKSHGPRYRQRRWGSQEDSSSTTTESSERLGGGGRQGSEEPVSEEARTTLPAGPTDDSAADTSQQLADESYPVGVANEKSRAPNHATPTVVDGPDVVPTSTLTTCQPRPSTGDYDKQNAHGIRSAEDESGISNTPSSKLDKAKVPAPVVPVLPLNRRSSEADVEVTKYYCLRWAEGTRGKALMQAVDVRIQEWLCTQAGKGICISEEILAISAYLGSSTVHLGPLARQLYLPESVSCALGLRLRSAEWNDLQRRIDAARDILDVKAERACSEALAAFGGEACTPVSSDDVSLDEFAFIAKREEAALDITELELRHALCAEANRVAPAACESTAEFLFSRLQQTGSSSISFFRFVQYCARLLGITDTPKNLVQREKGEETPWAHRQPNSGTSRRSSTFREDSMASYSRASATLKPHQQLPQTVQSRIRRIEGVITRFATSSSQCRRGCARGNVHNGAITEDLGKQMLSQDNIFPGRQLDPRLAPRNRYHNTSKRPFTCVQTGPSTSSRRREYPRSAGLGVSITSFCRFIEGKRFHRIDSLEGLLRALSRAGSNSANQLREYVPVAASHLEGLAVNAVVSDAMAKRLDATKARGGISAAPAAESAGTARWGWGEFRRISAQFTPVGPPLAPARATMPTPGNFWRRAGRGEDISFYDEPTKATDSVEGRPARTGTARSGETASTTAARGRYSTNSARSSAAGSAYASASQRTSRAGLPGGDGYVSSVLSAWSPDGSRALSAVELVSAVSRVIGAPLQVPSAEALVERFAATTTHGPPEGVRWLGSRCRDELDTPALVQFLRPKIFSLSVMTPFGLVELALQDPILTLGGLRELLVNKMFWRQHNCKVQRSDRDNFCISRHCGSLPLDTESPDQRRKLVSDVLRNGEFLFVSARPMRRKRGDPRLIPEFRYKMGTKSAEPTRIRENSAEGMRAISGVSFLMPRNSTRGISAPAGGDRVSTAIRSNILGHTASSRRRATEVAIDFPSRNTNAPFETLDNPRAAVRASETARDVFQWNTEEVERWICETMELECYRGVFRRQKIDGAGLMGLTEETLRATLAITNAFHVRKIILHLHNLAEEGLGSGDQPRLPPRIASWKMIDVLRWCWQGLAVRDRQTLATLQVAGIDGHVLLAMTPADWHGLSARSLPSCKLSLSIVSAAARRLMSSRAFATARYRGLALGSHTPHNVKALAPAVHAFRGNEIRAEGATRGNQALAGSCEGSVETMGIHGRPKFGGKDQNAPPTSDDPPHRAPEQFEAAFAGHVAVAEPAVSSDSNKQIVAKSIAITTAGTDNLQAADGKAAKTQKPRTRGQNRTGVMAPSQRNKGDKIAEDASASPERDRAGAQSASLMPIVRDNLRVPPVCVLPSNEDTDSKQPTSARSARVSSIGVFREANHDEHVCITSGRGPDSDLWSDSTDEIGNLGLGRDSGEGRHILLQ